jgi:hypothetical protein
MLKDPNQYPQENFSMNPITTRKHVLITLMGCLLFGMVSAQENTSSVINAAGGSYSNDKISLDWSLGELLRIDTKSSANNALLVTQGFLQPDLGRQVVFVADPAFAPGEVKILPNPVKSILQFQLTLRQIGYVRCMLFSDKGERIYQTGFTYYGYGYSQSIDMTRLANGNYYLYVELEPVEGPVVRKGSFKVLKIN